MPNNFANNSGLFTYFVSAHGNFCEHQQFGSYIPLPPNVLVIMNCDAGKMNNNLERDVWIWNTITKNFLETYRSKRISRSMLTEFLTVFSSLYTETNTYCVYKNVCPNLLLSFNDDKSFISGIYELPVGVSLHTCEDVGYGPVCKEIKKLYGEDYLKEKLLKLNYKIATTIKASIKDTLITKRNDMLADIKEKVGTSYKILRPIARNSGNSVVITAKSQPSNSVSRIAMTGTQELKKAFLPVNTDKNIFVLGDILGQIGKKQVTANSQGTDNTFYNKLHVYIVNACTGKSNKEDTVFEQVQENNKLLLSYDEKNNDDSKRTKFINEILFSMDIVDDETSNSNTNTTLQISDPVAQEGGKTKGKRVVKKTNAIKPPIKRTNKKQSL
jgi:hypothetical protein